MVYFRVHFSRQAVALGGEGDGKIEREGKDHSPIDPVNMTDGHTPTTMKLASLRVSTD
jgi:hypothetical protein